MTIDPEAADQLSAEASAVMARVDESKCVGHACCVIAAPELFDLPPGATVAQVLLQSVPNELIELAQQAADECPMGAISLVRQ